MVSPQVVTRNENIVVVIKNREKKEKDECQRNKFIGPFL